MISNIIFDCDGVLIDSEILSVAIVQRRVRGFLIGDVGFGVINRRAYRDPRPIWRYFLGQENV